MPVSFPYRHFPNLWDDILAQTDRKTHLSLRLVCKTLRDVIDAREARHLLLEHEEGGHVTVRTFEHNMPGLSTLHPEAWANDCKLDHATTLTLHTRTVDLRGYIPPIIDVPKLAPLFPNVKTVRITTALQPEDSHTPYVPFQPETVVFFMNHLDMGGIFQHWWFDNSIDEHARDMEAAGLSPEAIDQAIKYARYDMCAVHDEQGDGHFDEWDDHYCKHRDRPLVPCSVTAHKVPESCRKIVVNMNGLDHTIVPMFPSAWAPPLHVEEVVIIVPQVTSSASSGDIHVKFEGYHGSFTGSILQTLELFGYNKTKYIIVGLELVTDDSVKKFNRLLYHQITTRLYFDVDYDRDDVITLAMPDQARRRAKDITESRKQRGFRRTRIRPGPLNQAYIAEAFGVASWVLEDAGGKDAKHCEVEIDDEGNVTVEWDPPTPPEPEPKMSLKEKVDGILARVETLTLDEYRARVGAETAALETVEFGRPEDYEPPSRRRDEYFYDWNHSPTPQPTFVFSEDSDSIISVDDDYDSPPFDDLNDGSLEQDHLIHVAETEGETPYP